LGIACEARVAPQLIVVGHKERPDLKKMGPSAILEGCKTNSRYGADEPRECILP
jgi:hypothetical protein